MIIGPFMQQIQQRASLSVSTQLLAKSGSVNLTADGTRDWVHWAYASDTAVNRKSGVTNLIGDVTVINGPAFSYSPGAVRQTYSWTDGTPTASASTRDFFEIAGDGSGFQIPVDADTTLRTIVLYVGLWDTTTSLEISLSDGSAPVWTGNFQVSNTIEDHAVTIVYRAASAGQTLTIEYLQAATSGDCSINAATIPSP